MKPRNSLFVFGLVSFLTVFALSSFVLAAPILTSNTTFVNRTSVSNVMTFNSTENVTFQVNVSSDVTLSDIVGNITNVTLRLGRPDGTYTNYTNSFIAPLTSPVVHNSTTKFWINFTQSMLGPAGTYNITWFATNSTGGINNTISLTFTVGKANIGFFLDTLINNARLNRSVLYADAIGNANISGSFNNSMASDASFSLFRINSTTGVSFNITNQNGSIIDVPVGVNEVLYGTSATMANYSAANSTARNLTVNQTTQFITIFLNGSSVSRAYEKGVDAINITISTNATVSDVSNNMLILVNFTGSNSSTLGNSTAFGALYNTTSTAGMTLGNYTVSANVSNSRNYTSATNDTIFIILRDTTPPVITGLTTTPDSASAGTDIVITTTSISDYDSATTTIKVTKPDSTSTTTAYTGNTHTYTTTGTEGTYTVLLTSTDASGNTATATKTFQITHSGGGSTGGGGGGGGGGGTGSKETKTINIAGGSGTLTMTKVTDHGIVSINIEVVNPANSIQISVQKLAGQPATVTHEISGTVYRFLEITKTGTTDSNVKDAKIRFEVQRSWIDDNNIDIGSVALNRYTSGGWQKLSTKVVGSDADSYTFESDSPGFSTFAITGQAAAAPTEPTPTETPTTPTEPTPTETPTTPTETTASSNMIWVIVGIIAAVAIGIGIYAAKNGKKKKDKH